MKKTEKLISVIRKVVREEVKKAIREELNEVLGKKKLTKETIRHGMKLADVANSPKNPYEQGKSRKKHQEFEFTRDPILNKVLNETANEEWPTMGGKTYSDGKEGLASMMGLESPDQMFGQKPSAQQMVPKDRQHLEVDDNMAQVLTRDYTDLMKAINKKKGK